MDKFIDLALFNSSQSLKKFLKNQVIFIDNENNILFSKQNSNPDAKVYMTLVHLFSFMYVIHKISTCIKKGGLLF